MKLKIENFKKGDLITVLKLDKQFRLSIGSIFDAEKLFLECTSKNHFTLWEDNPYSGRMYPIINEIKTCRGARCLFAPIRKYINEADHVSYFAVIYNNDTSVKLRPATYNEIVTHSHKLTKEGNVGSRGRNIILSKDMRNYLKSGNGKGIMKLVNNIEHGSYLILSPLYNYPVILDDNTYIFDTNKSIRIPTKFIKFNKLKTADTLNIYYKYDINGEKTIVVEGKPGTCVCCGSPISRYETPVIKKKQCISCSDSIDVLRSLIKDNGLENTVKLLNTKMSKMTNKLVESISNL